MRNLHFSFFCNFCTQQQKKGAFGLASETNLCKAKAGQVLPFDWKVCPPESSQKFSPFSYSLQRQVSINPTRDLSISLSQFKILFQTGDVVAQLQLFMKSPSNVWTQVACKKAIFTYRVGLVNGRQFGSSSKAAGSSGSDVSIASNGLDLIKLICFELSAFINRQIFRLNLVVPFIIPLFLRV